MLNKRYVEGKGFLLGVTATHDYIYMRDFSWDCGWYWGGGYMTNCYKNTRCSGHYHFDSTYLTGANAIEKYNKDFVKSTLTESEWYRLLDLMTQFYNLRKSAEIFQYGGHYTSKGRTEKELNKDQADFINNHIKEVIIPEVKKVLTEGLS